MHRKNIEIKWINKMKLDVEKRLKKSRFFIIKISLALWKRVRDEESSKIYEKRMKSKEGSRTDGKDNNMRIFRLVSNSLLLSFSRLVARRQRSKKLVSLTRVETIRRCKKRLVEVRAAWDMFGLDELGGASLQSKQITQDVSIRASSSEL